MDLQKTISSTGELLFEFAVSIVLIPRTMLKVLRNPVWSVDYLTSQTGETAKEQHEKYSHPILFWIVIGILPYYFLINTYFQGYTDGKVLETYNRLDTSNIIGGLSILLVSFPLSCAFILQLFKYKSFTKIIFKRSFFIQLYLTALVQLFYLPFLFIDELPDIMLLIFGGLGLAILIWFMIAELLIIRKELSYNWFASIGVLILMYLVFYIFAGICCLIFFLINMGNFQKLLETLL